MEASQSELARFTGLISLPVRGEVVVFPWCNTDITYYRFFFRHRHCFLDSHCTNYAKVIKDKWRSFALFPELIKNLFLRKDTSFYLLIACTSKYKPFLYGLHLIPWAKLRKCEQMLLNSLYFRCFQHSFTYRSIFRAILSFHAIHWIYYKLQRWFSF